MAQRSRGGFFGGETSPEVESTDVEQEQGSTERSEGGFFGGNTSTTPPITPEAPAGGTSDNSDGGLFNGESSEVPVVERQPSGGTSDQSQGGFFTGAGGDVEVEQGPQGPTGPAGRGIERIDERIENGNVILNIIYTDGSSEPITYPAGTAQLPDILQNFTDDLTNLPINATNTFGIRKIGNTDVSLNQVSTGGGGGGTVTTNRLVLNFGTTTTATINGSTTTVDVNFTNNSIDHQVNPEIADDATVEVNGITFFPAVDYMIVNGLLTFTDYELQQGDGDLIVITWTEIS